MLTISFTSLSRSLFDSCDVSYTSFVRTTDADHRDTVIDLWNKIAGNGHLEKARYSGWYSVQDETFLTENQTEMKDGKR